MALLRIEDLTFTYPEQHEPVLSHINLSVNQGEFLVLFGESGSGKTSLLKMIKRELRPHGQVSGEIYFEGEKLSDLTDKKAAKKIAYVMQNPEAQIVTDKVWHELAFGLENLGETQDTIRRRVGEIANFFGIHHLFEASTANLSGGQKQLINLASIMVMQPELLILDEPTSQLDPIAARHFINTLKMLNEELGLTIIIVEHRLEDVLPLADRVILLEKGRLIVDSAPDKLANKLTKEHPLVPALPTATSVFLTLGYEGETPLSVKEGRDFLTENYQSMVYSHTYEALNEAKVIELKDVYFRYEKKSEDILEGVNFSVHENEVLCILGGNGSGKTTLLNVLSNQAKPYRGKVLIRGKKINKYKANELFKHNLAVLPQDPQTVFIQKTLREDYEEMAKVLAYSEEKMQSKINYLAKILKLEDLLEQHPYDLSGGEQQKAALAKVLLLEPKILLLDEPTKGIDAFAKESLLQIIQDLKAQGLTLIIVTHDVEFAARTSDRVGLFFNKSLLSLTRPHLFFSENNFYTTQASRMSRHLFKQAITREQIISLCEAEK